MFQQRNESSASEPEQSSLVTQDKCQPTCCKSQETHDNIRKTKQMEERKKLIITESNVTKSVGY